MPDPLFKTVSASQVPEMLGLSPWGSRLTLHHQFETRTHDDRKQDVRMKIGKLFEKLILELTAEALALEVHHNDNADYVRHATYPLGCTVDATVLCPTRGRGTVEAKAIDKYEWQRSWTETSPPKYYVAQLEAQMLVKGDTWGVIACFIYNEGADGRLVLYERRPNAKAQARIIKEAEEFMADLAAGRRPPAFGLPVELDTCNEMFPETDPEKVLEDVNNYEMAEFARLYAWTAKQATQFKRAVDEMKPKLVAFMGDHGVAALGGGVVVKIKKPQVAGQLVRLPADLRKRLRFAADFMEPGPEHDAVMEAIDWVHVVRGPSNQNRIAVREDGDIAEAEDTPTVLEAG